jgi:hypothetical protein
MSGNKKVKYLISYTALAVVVFIVAAFAWFIGMQTVVVESFDIEIASTDSLLLSLNGEKWATTVSITKETVDEVSYPGHTNKWAGRGLIPLSTSGEVDPETSRLILYEKSSMATTKGGYRLMASRVPNYGPVEEDGYVVFDLFIKNFSGNKYYTEDNINNEEPIYLTVESEVGVAETGVENTGIENSIRVAFAQIGRVERDVNDQSLITSITCNPDEFGKPSYSGGITGICKTGAIWEPNDIYHVENAINYYQTTCNKRIGSNIYDPQGSAYTNESCGEILNNVAYPTYAIREEIVSSDRIDVYDGLEYNSYPIHEKLYKFPYFTDTDRDKEGIDRPPLMFLAPRSITKVRVYVYLEGQDIDNYTFASIGRKVSVTFGFTKERFEGEDFGYDGPDLEPAYNLIAPVLTLNGSSEITINKGTEYIELGATAIDDLDGDISENIIISGTVDTDVVGEYIIKYNVRDWAGNWAEEITRTVTVK